MCDIKKYESILPHYMYAYNSNNLVVYQTDFVLRRGYKALWEAMKT